MFAKSHRFHGYGSLRTVYRRGRTVRGPLLGLRAAAQRGPERPYRVAVVVSRKISKSAVVRNRIRRRVYEAVRTSQNRPEPGADLVFTAFSARLADLPATELQDLVGDLLHQATSRPGRQNN